MLPGKTAAFQHRSNHSGEPQRRFFAFVTSNYALSSGSVLSTFAFCQFFLFLFSDLLARPISSALLSSRIETV